MSAFKHVRDFGDFGEMSADVCIVGAGAAGISIALSLIDSGVSVILLDSGGDDKSDDAQDLYAGSVTNEQMHSPPDKYRVRAFGGSTTLWGGRCMPYDRIDLEERDWISNSGWPIQWSELEGYYPDACKLAEVGKYEFSVPNDDARAPAIVSGFSSESLRTDGVEKFSCPTDFGSRYVERLKSASNVHIVQGANCVRINLDSSGSHVVSVQFKGLRGGTLVVSAGRYILAVGGIEAARLLLNSNDVQKEGIGNESDVVGRYYMCHMAGVVGDVHIKKPIRDVSHGYFFSSDGVYSRRRFSLSEECQRKLRVGNLIARLHFPKIADPRHGNGILSGLYIARSFISYEYGKRLNDGEKGSLMKTMRHFSNIVIDSPSTLQFLHHWVTKRSLAERKFPSVIIPNKTNRFTLDVHSEQEPNPNSRITLGSERDALGMRRVAVDWNYTKRDVETVSRTLRVFDSEFRKAGVGAISFNEDTLESDLLRFGAYGGHHIGTARMGSDRKSSVVNSDCRVHSVRNLYVAGSAVFPTSSQANPTLTIIALAIRLAEHVAKLEGKKIKPWLF